MLSHGDDDSQYAPLLAALHRDGVHFERVTDDTGLGVAIAAALTEANVRPPRSAPTIGNAVQGNLTEFLVWDLGHRRWRLYERPRSVATNARTPWKPSSDHGIDILAARSKEEVHVVVVEVKSTRGSDVDQICGASGTLQADFTSLFEGRYQGRLPLRLGSLVGQLEALGDPDLVDEVMSCVGDAPNSSPRCLLVPVLVRSTSGAGAPDEDAVVRKMHELRAALVTGGWQAAQVHSCVVEAASVKDVLDAAINAAAAP